MVQDSLFFVVNGSRFSIFPGPQPNRSSPEILPDSCARSNISQPVPVEHPSRPYSGFVTSESQASPANRHRSWALLAIVVGMVLVGIGADYWYRYTGTPEYSLSQLGKAVKAKNYGAASQFVNEERIAADISDSLTDVLLAKYTQTVQATIPFPFTDSRIEMLQIDGATLSSLDVDRHAQCHPPSAQRQRHSHWHKRLQAASTFTTSPSCTLSAPKSTATPPM